MNGNLTPKEAVALQRELARKVDVATPLPEDWELVGATDISFNLRGDRVFAAVVVLERGTLRVVERQGVVLPPAFPYVPGLLSFRELPPLLAAWRKLRKKPDVVLADGQGYAHPRRIGIASHLGLLVGRPTVGCAKSVLCGRYDEPDDERGSRTPLVHRGETVGEAVRTRTGVSPVFVSAGHQATLATAVALVLETSTKYRIPDPLREAHRYANELRLDPAARATAVKRGRRPAADAQTEP